MLAKLDSGQFYPYSFITLNVNHAQGQIFPNFNSAMFLHTIVPNFG